MMKPIAFKTVPSMNRIRCKLLMLTWLILVSSGVQATPIWHTFGAYEYALTDEYLNFLDAENLAQSQYGAHLASIHSDEENSFILALVLGTVTADGRYGVVWLGARQTGDGYGDPFVWLDGTPVDYWGVQRDDSRNHKALLMFYDYSSSYYYPGSWGDWSDSGLSLSIVPRAVMKRLTIAANNPPIADAGDDFGLREQTMGELFGSGFDDDGDAISYLWTQTAGIPVTLSDATLPNPNFIAPGGDAQLEFTLVVNDGVVDSNPDSVVVIIAGNNAPLADAGDDATVDEFMLVALDGSGSNDPDGDSLSSYAWEQIGGPAVDLLDDTSISPSFVAPQVPAGGVDLVFDLVVTDDFAANPLASSPDTVTLHVANVYDPPSCELAYPSSSSIWPPNHKLVPVTLEGISSTQNLSTDILVYAVTQDEPLNAGGDGNTNPDAALMLQGTIDSVLLRAERDGEGNGRVYTIYFDAENEFESCSGSIQVGVPHSRKSTAVDSGEAYSSL